MRPFTIFHINDLHGRDIALAQIASLITQLQRAMPEVPSLLLDAGDSQSKDDRSLAELTRGAAMHRLLRLMGCQASVLGNKCIPQWGLDVVIDYAHYMPILLSNLTLPNGKPIKGTQPTVLLPIANGLLGVIGITDDEAKFVDKYRLKRLPLIKTIRQYASHLRQKGANAIVLLSHMGFLKDRMIAEDLQGEIDLIIGGHSHTALPVGQSIGDILVVQAGAYGKFLGRIDLAWSSVNTLIIQKASLIPIVSEIPQSATIMKEIATIRAEIGLTEHL